jgi:hypothetical protein
LLFNKTSKGIKKWKVKAMLTDLHKTRISIELSEKQKHVPPWVYRALAEPFTNDEDKE